MWIADLDIRGFRRLARRFTLGPGLTVVVGENEAGKSTLHEALVRSLYGFAAGERRKKGDGSEKDARRPWTGGAYGLVARLGRRGEAEPAFIADWDFEKHSVRLLDAATGSPIPEVVAERPPGEYLLGLSLEDFRQVCCLDQAALGSVQRSDTLRVALEQAVSSAQGDIGVNAADTRLAGALGVLGTHARTYKPLAGGKWRELLDEHAALTGELAGCRTQRERLAVAAVEAAAAERESDGQAAAVRRAEQALLLAGLQELEQRLGDVETLRDRAAARPESPRVLPATAVEAVTGARAALGPAELKVQELERAAAGLAERLVAEQETVRAAQAAAEELAAYAALDPSAETRVRELGAALVESAGAAAEPAVTQPERDPALAQFRSERDAIAALAAPLRRPSIIVVVLTFGLALLLHGRKVRRRSEQLSAALAAFGGGSLADLDARVAAEEMAAAGAAALAAARDRRLLEAVRRSAAIETELAGALDAAGAAPADNLRLRARAYLEGCAHRADRDRRELALERALAGLATVREPLAELDRRRGERDALRGRLDGELAVLGIATADREAAARAFDAAVAASRADEHAIADADAAAQALTAALAGESPAAFTARVEQARAALAGDLARHGPLVEGDPGSADVLKERLTLARASATEASGRAIDLRSRLAQAEQGLAVPAELEERLADGEERIARIEQATAAIRIARDELRAAAEKTYREFAPHLNARLAESLPRITRGRYREALVDADLNVTVVAPETGQYVSVEQLSRGTRDQIFLVQRLELARLLDTTAGAAPLLLDDPFAHFDLPRLRLGLALLAEIAEARQVILFTEDTRVVDFARAADPAVTVVELEAPPDGNGAA